ncbi:MAG TPA: site-specific integrase [Bryobacteraceae bacterium]
MIAAKRRKQDEFRFPSARRGPELAAVPRAASPAEAESKPATNTRTALASARDLFLKHIEAHSPDKPETVRRYRQVLEHFVRLCGEKQFLENVSRADIDEYKIARRQEKSERHNRLITARTVNFEVSTLRTFFYYFINERGVSIKNLCARFKRLRDAKKGARRRPPTYCQEELDALFAKCDEFETAVFATLLLTGLRKRELYFLTWADLEST